MFLPEQWLVNVAVKKVAYGIAKGLAGVLAYSKAQSLEQTLGIHIDPTAFQTGCATFILGTLSAIHDWAKLKWPNAQWL